MFWPNSLWARVFNYSKNWLGGAALATSDPWETLKPDSAHCSGSLLGMGPVSTLFEQHDFSASANVSTTVLLTSLSLNSRVPTQVRQKSNQNWRNKNWTWTVILMLFMLDMTDLRCVNAGNIRGNVSSNDLLATGPTQFCVKLSDSSRALWPGDELKMEQFQHLQTSTPSHFDWTPGNTSFISSTRLAITVNFTLSVESIIKLNSFQAHLAWSSFPFNKTKIWFQFLIIETWDGPLIFCLYYITYCGLKASKQLKPFSG